MITNRNDVKLFVYSYDVLSQEYVIKSCIEKPIYVSYKRIYDEIDSAKIVAEATEQNAQVLKKGNIIWIESKVCMMIDSIALSSDEKKITVVGSLCDGVLSKRILPTEISFENSALSYVFGAIFQASQGFPAFTFATQNLSNLYYTGTITPGVLLDIVQDLCKKFSLGFTVEKQLASYNELELSLIVYKGQDESEHIIMSRDFGTLSEIEYTENSNSEINFVKVFGDNDLYAEVSVPNTNDSTRVESVLDCRNIKQGEMSDNDYLQVLTNKGQEYLNEHTNLKTYSGDYVENSFIAYEDFNVGDIVKVSDKELDIDDTQRVVLIQIQYDINGRYIDLQLGDIPKSTTRVISTLSKKVEKIETTPEPESGGGGGGTTINITYAILVQAEDVI